MTVLAKRLIYIVISVLVPALYSIITSYYPEFPLNESIMSDLAIWIIGIFFGGWQTTKIYKELKITPWNL